MRHLANPALNLQVEASNAAAPELAGVVVPHTASIQMHAAQNQIFGLVLALATVRGAAKVRRLPEVELTHPPSVARAPTLAAYEMIRHLR